ncbi:hypothetical protein HN51_016423 [Arachis hypogaea]|nr:uncharacterized protein DS421_6g192360 [Arachis hypogaea]
MARNSVTHTLAIILMITKVVICCAIIVEFQDTIILELPYSPSYYYMAASLRECIDHCIKRYDRRSIMFLGACLFKCYMMDSLTTTLVANRECLKTLLHMESHKHSFGPEEAT